MRALQLAAVRALCVSARGQGVMGPAHVATGFRCLFLWNSHVSILSTLKGGPEEAACATRCLNVKDSGGQARRALSSPAILQLLEHGDRASRCVVGPIVLVIFEPNPRHPPT